MRKSRAMEVRLTKKMMLFPFLDMSQIKKFFGKIKSEVKFAKAGEGHRLNEPTSNLRYVEPQPRAQQTMRQSSNNGAAAQAAAEAAQQRLQQQQSRLQSGAPSKKRKIY